MFFFFFQANHKTAESQKEERKSILREKVINKNVIILINSNFLAFFKKIPINIMYVILSTKSIKGAFFCMLYFKHMKKF